MTTPKRIVEVQYLDNEHTHNPRGTKTYHYFVPNSIKGDLRPDDLVVLQSQAGFLSLAKIVSVVLDGDRRALLASRRIIAVVDVSHHHREQKRIARRAELLAALDEMERKRQEDLRLKTLVYANPTAGPLVNELRALEQEA